MHGNRILVNEPDRTWGRSTALIRTVSVKFVGFTPSSVIWAKSLSHIWNLHARGTPVAVRGTLE